MNDNIKMGRLYRRIKGMNSVLFPGFIYTICVSDATVSSREDRKIIKVLSLYQNQNDWIEDIIMLYRIQTEYEVVSDDFGYKRRKGVQKNK